MTERQRNIQWGGDSALTERGTASEKKLECCEIIDNTESVAY